MNATITSLGGRAPLCEIRGRLLQNLIRAFQLEVLALEILQLLAFVRRQTRAPALVAFGLPHPSAQRFDRAAEFLGHRSNRGPL